MYFLTFCCIFEEFIIKLFQEVFLLGLNEVIKIGDRLKSYRINLKLTQAEMALKLGLPRSTYANYEKNIREPNTETLNKIAAVFGITVSKLIGADKKTFGNKLKELRENNDLDQSNLAKILEVSPESISHYENGGEPDFNTLNKIADYFEVTNDYLTGRSNLKTIDDVVLMKLASNSVKQDSFFNTRDIELTEEYKTQRDKIILNNLSSLNKALNDYFEIHSNYKIEVNNIFINIIKDLTQLINFILELSKDSNYKYCLDSNTMNETLKNIYINSSDISPKYDYSNIHIKPLSQENDNKPITSFNDLSKQFSDFNNLYCKVTINLSHISDIVSFGLEKLKREYTKNLSSNINTLADFSKKQL
jgi:transcriptional regulator with XRE-family HTH domain